MVYGTYNELVTGANLNQQTSLGGLTLYDILEVEWDVMGQNWIWVWVNTY